MATVEIFACVRRDQVISAIKLVREITGFGLAESKAVVDAARAGGRAATLTVASASAAGEFARQMTAFGFPSRVIGGVGPPASPNL